MYEIFLKTWYQETPEKTYDEIMYESDDFEEICHYFMAHAKYYIDYFPVQEMGIRNKIG